MKIGYDRKFKIQAVSMAREGGLWIAETAREHVPRQEFSQLHIVQAVRFASLGHWTRNTV